MTDSEQQFVTAYFKAALWSTSASTPDDPDDEQALEEWATKEDIAPRTREIMEAEALAFYHQNWAFIPDPLIEQAGYDFWLTRNQHGSGFWDSPNVWGDAEPLLTERAHAAGERDLYVGDDWRIYQQQG